MDFYLHKKQDAPELGGASKYLHACMDGLSGFQEPFAQYTFKNYASST